MFDHFGFLCMKGLNLKIYLSLSWRRSLSCRNQSIDLQSKSIDWFLYYLSLCEKLSNMSKIAFFGYSLALFTQVKPKVILPRIILPKADRESSTYTNLLFLFFFLWCLCFFNINSYHEVVFQRLGFIHLVRMQNFQKAYVSYHLIPSGGKKC